MKKLLSVLIVVFFVCGILSSCGGGASLCPAYPPSPLNGEIEQQENPNIDYEYLNIENNKSL